MNWRSKRTEPSAYIHDYHPGDLVTVTGGPFRGQEGQVTAICYETVQVGWPRARFLHRPSEKVERLWFRPENIRRACHQCCR